MVKLTKLLSHMPFGSNAGNPDLWSLRHEAEDDRFLRIFADFAKLIRNSEKACEKAAQEDDADYRDLIVNEECEYLEELIGASFVILQAKIRRVTEAALSLRKSMLSKHDIKLDCLRDARNIRALSGNYKTSNSSLVQLVWDIANYYKHRDEWPVEVWEDEPSDGTKEPNAITQGRHTRRSVERAGIKLGSTGNLRNAYAFFGIDPYSNCKELAETVQRWAVDVYKSGYSQLKEEIAACPDFGSSS